MLLSSFAIILMEKRAPFALRCLSSWCLVMVSVLWLFLTVAWVRLQCVLVVFADHTYFYLPFSRLHTYFYMVWSDHNVSK